MQLAVRRLLLALPLLAGAACAHPTLVARAALPPGESAGPLIVYTRDATLPGYRLASAAELLAATPDSLSIAVRVVHPVDDIADPDRWTVTLEDGSGRALAPAARIQARRARLAIDFRRTSREFAPPPPHLEKILPAATAYQGDAVYRFDAVGLGAPVRGRELRLRVVRPDGVTLRYDWTFRDGPIEVAHHGWTVGATGIGALVIPGEATRIASSELLR